MNPKELLQRMKLKNAPPVLDVRTAGEFASGHIPGAIHAPTMKIMFNPSALPADKKQLIVVTCELGPRAQMAKGILAVRGYQNVELLDGHMSAWRRSNYPLER